MTTTGRGDDEKRPLAVLAVLDGEPRGGLFGLFAGENPIGSEPSSLVQPQGPDVQARHASIVCEAGVFALLAHAEPTFVNAEPVDVCELDDGDVIRIGSTTLRFRTLPGL